MKDKKNLLLLFIYLTLGLGIILGMLLVMTRIVPVLSELGIWILATIGFWCEIVLIVLTIVRIKKYEIQIVPKA